MGRVSLQIFKVDGVSGDNTRYVAEKWEFHDEMMGARYIMLNATSHTPIDWRIGDYLMYRGQRYYLNNVPTVTQNARPNEAGDAFVYESVRFDDDQGKMYDCMVLDVTPTTGDYIAARGTNYTGSSVFNIYCAETTVEMKDAGGDWHSVTLSPVAYIGGIIQANLNRLYPQDGWRVDVNPALVGLDDKVISINKWYVPQALAEIHNVWDVDYICIGRTIKIGYTLNNVTGDDSASYMFGYGEGYAQRGDDGKSLLKIKRTASSSQKIITRLRAMGSTRNMPYRYYNEKYELPQSMFVQNLQLPDTFETPANKASGNASRDASYGFDGDGYPILRHVLGDSNDAYIDKHDNAASCPEGIREGAAFWDGSDSNLEEIYPTIKSGTYRDLRAANIPDMDGRIASQESSPTNAYPNYGNTERIDVLLGVDSNTNIGDGIMTEEDVKNQHQVTKHVEVEEKTFVWNGNSTGAFNVSNGNAIAKEQNADTLFEIENVAAGKYHTEPVTQNVNFYVKYAGQPNKQAKIRYRFRIWKKPEGEDSFEMIVEHISPELTVASNAETYASLTLPSIPNVDKETQGEDDTELEVSEKSNIKVTFNVELVGCSNIDPGNIIYHIGSAEEDVEPEYIWGPQNAADSFINTPFCIYIKDIGIDLSNISTTGDDATIHFNTGACGGMDFKWNPNNVEPITVGNKKGWKVEITERFTDDTIHAYYPSQNSPLSAGDQFVLLNIEFPEAYIKIAELRLLDAATKYLADNCEQKYIYEPEISDIYIQRNIDFCEAANAPETSIYWNLYAGYKFSMRGIPDTEDQVLPIIDNVTIKTVTIREGEQDTPKVEIVLNNEVDQSTLQKLTVTVDRIYNGIFGQGGGGGSAVSYSTLISLLNSEGSKLFLSKKNNDTAAGKITFTKGLDAKAGSSFTGIGNTGNIINSGTLTQQGNVTFGIGSPSFEDNPTISSANRVDGFSGWYLDNFGNMELESLTVRSYLEVMELLINRLQAQEGDTIFAENDQIESVEEETEGNTTTYLLTLKEKWDGYFTAQEEGNILKGIINTLAAKQAGVSDESSSTGQDADTGGNKYYTSWMYVTNVYDNVPVLDEDGEPVLNGEGNPKTTRKIRVALWSDDQVPAQRNFPPCAKMNIARWGCMLDPTDDRYTTAQKQSIIKRQRLFYISTSDGRIMKLSHVNKPILEEWNYGTTLGTIPEFMWQWQEVAEKALPTRDYLYAQGIIYQSLIHVNPQGVPIGVFVDKGVWQNNTAYLHYAWNAETGQWETHDVWWMGCKWRFLVTQPVVSGGTSTYYEPAFNSDYWTLIEGNETFTLELTSSNGEQFQEGAVDTTITPRLYYGSNIEITAQIDSYNWSWKRRTSSTDGTSQADITWNGLHSGVKNLAITDEDMPEEWSSSNKAIFTCRVGISKNNSVVYVEKDFFISHIISGRQGDPTPEYQLLYYGWSRYATTANQTISPSDIGEDDWTEFIPSAETGKPYLWLKTERWVWNKTYDANNRPIYILDNRQESPTPTYSRITGESGTGFQPKGSVANETALRALSGMAVGDAWMVENTGHLWVWSGTGWVDFGEIRGENGLSSYIHLAWAHAVATHSASATHGAGVYPDDGMGFTTSKDAGQNFEYIGFLADNVVQDSQDPWKYTWKHMGSVVYLNLDNDSDTILYSGDIPLSSATSQATLYIGGTPVTSGVTFSIEFSRSGNQNTVSGNITQSGLVTINSITENTGWALVKATYSNVIYAAKFSLRRSENDKYEIIPLASGIAYNSTKNEPVSSIIEFKIRRTGIDGSMEYVDNQDTMIADPQRRTKELNVYGVYDDGTLESIEWEGHHADGELYLFEGYNEDYAAYRIELVDIESSIIDDSEDIPILKFNDGVNGKDAVSLIVTPPAIVIQCDSDNMVFGNDANDEYWECDIHADLRRGNEQATITSITINSIPSGSNQYITSTTNGVLKLKISRGSDMSDGLFGQLVFTVVGQLSNGVQISAVGRINITYTSDGSPGAAGKDSVRLDLDNESDSMQYSSSGEQITSAVITRASLYDGNSLKSSGITWAYELYGIPDANETDGIVVGDFSSGVKPFTIRKITQENATLTVKATYKSTTYRAIFSIKKLLNKDKYEIVVNPDAITFNPDEQSTPAQDLVVQINHWSPSGAYSQVSSTSALTTGTGLRLYAARVSASGTETLGDPVAISSGQYTIAKGSITTSLSAYRFILKDGVGGNILDSETVPIAKLHSGTSIYADLSNEMDAVPMDKDGNVLGSNTLTTTFNLYYGTAKQTLTSLTGSKIGETSNPSKVTVSPVASTGLVTITISQGATFTNDKLTIRLEGSLTINGQQISKQLDFTIQGVRAGDDGKSPTIYQLNPSDSTIKKNKNATLSPSVVTCNIIKRVGDSAPVAIPASGDGNCIVYFKRDIDNDWVQYSSGYVTNGISTAGTTTGIKFRLYSGDNTAGTLLDSETLPLVEDGKDGSGSNAVRLDLTNEMDSIQYSGTTKVGANAQTTARLYDGAQEVTSGVTFSIDSREGCDSTTATASGQVFTISGIASNATQARITIKAVHTKNNVSNTYYATFTVKKLVDQPKYELVVKPDALSYNSDNDQFSSDPEININIRQTDINGDVTTLTTLTNKGLWLNVYRWNFRTQEYENALGTNGKTSGTLPLVVDASNDTEDTAFDYYIELRKTSSGGELLDHENIPITTVQNGEAGVAILAQYAPNSNPTSSQIHNTFTSGDQYMRTKRSTDANWGSWVRIVGESGGETDYKFNISSNATSTSASTPPASRRYETWQDAPMATTNDYQYLWAQVQKKDGNGNNVGPAYYIRLTGEAGPAGTTYEIRSTMGEVVIGENADSATLNTTVSLYQSIGLNPATNLQAYFTWYRRIGSTFYKLGYSQQIGDSFQISASVRTSSADDIVVFARTSGVYTSTYAPTQSIPTDYLAKLEIPVRKQGGQGPTGPEGPSGKNAIHINIDNQADLISCYSDGKVRYARTIVTEVTIYDGAEYATTNVGIVTSSSSLTIGGCLVGREDITSNGVIVGYRFTWEFTTEHVISQAVSKGIVLSYNGVNYSTSFSLVPTNSSAIYQLAPEPTSISFARASNGIDFASPTTVYVKLHARKIEGANSALITTPTVGNAEGLSIMWKRVGVDSSFRGSEVGANNDTGIDVGANTNCTSLALQLYKDNVLIDEEDISVMRAGKDGDGTPATSYSIVVTSSSASINASGQLVANITWRVKRNTGGDDYDVSLNNSNSFYKLNTDSNWTGAGTSSSSPLRSLSYNQEASKPFPTSISLLYGTSSNPLATTEIPITIMGQMGRNFYYAGIWSANVEYTLTDFSAPFVILRETGQPDFYYVMQGENRTIKGNAHKPSNTNTDWHEMETSFKYLITEAVFTDFAKLGSAVFNKDYMFSQEGYMVGYNKFKISINDESQYQYLDPHVFDADYEIGFLEKSLIDSGRNQNGGNIHINEDLENAVVNNRTQTYSNTINTGARLSTKRYYAIEVIAYGNVDNQNATVRVQITHGTYKALDETFAVVGLANVTQNYVFVNNENTDATSNYFNISISATGSFIDTHISYFNIGYAKFIPSLYMNLMTGQMVANDLVARGMLYASSVAYSMGRVQDQDQRYVVGDESMIAVAPAANHAVLLFPEPTTCKGRVIDVYNYISANGGVWYFGQQSLFVSNQKARFVVNWNTFEPSTMTTINVEYSAVGSKHIKAISRPSGSTDGNGHDIYEWVIFD